MKIQIYSLVVHPGMPGCTETSVSLLEGTEMLPVAVDPDAVGLGLLLAAVLLVEPTQGGAVPQLQEGGGRHAGDSTTGTSGQAIPSSPS